MEKDRHNHLIILIIIFYKKKKKYIWYEIFCHLPSIVRLIFKNSLLQLFIQPFMLKIIWLDKNSKYIKLRIFKVIKN